MKIKDVQHCKFIAVTDLIPQRWAGWFYSAMRDNTPFMWGNNNRTLIATERFIEEANTVLGDSESLRYENFAVPPSADELEQLTRDIQYLIEEDIYVDLEN